MSDPVRTVPRSVSAPFSSAWYPPEAKIASNPARYPVPIGTAAPSATIGAMDCCTVISFTMTSCVSLLAPITPTRA